MPRCLPRTISYNPGMKSAATPATAYLARHGVEYTEHEFEYKEHGGTSHSSASMGVLSPVLVDVALEE